MHIKSKNNSAFTLAEVLITLSIIGIVAAMTIPSLVTAYQKNIVATQYEKIYSLIAQAIHSAEAENGMSDGWSVVGAAVGGTTTQSFADKYFYPYVKVSQKCSFSETACWKDSVSLDNTGGYVGVGSNSLSAILPNGASILFWTGGSPVYNAQVWIDIDGPNKGKAMLGKDVFGIKVNFIDNSPDKKGVFAAGGGTSSLKSEDTLLDDATYGCSSTKASGKYAGLYCGALIQINDWKIPDKYPW